jgi:hypothetical protein
MNQTTKFSTRPARKQLCAWIATIFFFLLPCLVRADIVTDWTEEACDAIESEHISGGFAPARILAIMHTAMFDAVNAIDKRYRSYSGATFDAKRASPEVAAHAAARRALAELLPGQKSLFDATFDAAMVHLPDGAARSAGIAIGEKSAMTVIGQRKEDGVKAHKTYRPLTAAGVYVPTTMPALTYAANIKPLALKSVSQFRPGPPYALSSPAWARDYNETRELGSSRSTKRSARQTETARFWVMVGTAAWNQAACMLSANQPQPLIESARMFAHLNLAIADAFLAVFEAKYQYNFWRPITAIRNGDQDGNDATERDAGWTPGIDTPMHPEYPCAHCTVDTAAGTVLKSAFGTGKVPKFTLTFADMPGVTRSYTSIRQLEDEVAMSRIWGGVHYRTSNEVGHALGKKIGSYVLSNHLQPVR